MTRLYILHEGWVKLDFSLLEKEREEFECWLNGENINTTSCGKSPGLIFSAKDAEKVTKWLEEHSFVKAVIRDGAWTAP